MGDITDESTADSDDHSTITKPSNNNNKYDEVLETDNLHIIPYALTKHIDEVINPSIADTSTSVRTFMDHSTVFTKYSTRATCAAAKRKPLTLYLSRHTHNKGHIYRQG